MGARALKKGPMPFEVGDLVFVPKGTISTKLKEYSKALAPHLTHGGFVRVDKASKDPFVIERQTYAKSLETKVRVFSGMDSIHPYKVTLASWSVVEIEFMDVAVTIPTKGLMKKEGK